MMKTMIYVASLSREPDRDHGWIYSFEQLGWKVIPFRSEVEHKGGPLVWQKIKRRFHCGSTNEKMRRDLLELCRENAPEWIHFRLPLNFTRRHIMALKESGAIVTEYFNDDPFSPRQLFGLNWRFKHALPAYDAHFVYRKRNLNDFEKAGAAWVEHCPPALDASRFASVFLPITGQHKAYDVAFIGHYENDGRLQYLEALYGAGFNVVVHGSGWAAPVLTSNIKHLYPAEPIFGVGYGELYASSLCGLCFFSKINRDTWTERPLEIIAVNGLLVCERTEEATGYFREGEEAFFFSSPDELLSICARLKNNPLLAAKVRKAAKERLLGNEGFTIHDRAVQVERFVREKLELREASFASSD